MSTTFKLSAQTDVPEFNRALLAWINRHPGRIKTVLRGEMRSLLRLVMRFTPPARKKQGEDALERDINNAVRPLRLKDFRGSHSWARNMRRAIRDQDMEVAQILMRRSSPKHSGLTVVPFSPELHLNARGIRNRVRKPTGFATLDEQDFDAYVDEMLPRVGNAKGGWAKGLLALGGTVADWVRRHEYAGEFEDRLESSNPSITVANKSSWGKGERSGRSNGNADRVVRNALRSRGETLAKKLAKAQEEDMKR